jgi:hypothetical protein
MNGRSWMYFAQVEGGYMGGQRLCEHNDYWRSVIEAVEIARKASNCLDEAAWFLAPIPDSQPHWASPTTLAAGMEGV